MVVLFFGGKQSEVEGGVSKASVIPVEWPVFEITLDEVMKSMSGSTKAFRTDHELFAMHLLNMLTSPHVNLLPKKGEKSKKETFLLCK